MAELQQRIQGSLIPIAGHGDAMGLEHLGLAEMQVGNKQLPPLKDLNLTAYKNLFCSIVTLSDLLKCNFLDYWDFIKSQ